MNGSKYIKKRVALPNRRPLPVDTSEGISSMGIAFLKPYFRVVYTIRKLIVLPTSN